MNDSLYFLATNLFGFGERRGGYSSQLIADPLDGKEHAMPITGACLCGAVRYQINGQLLDGGNCHCSMCRKAHGAAFATYASFGPESFRWVSGEDLVSYYDSSPNESRMFCRVCGSTLGATEDGRIGSITLGTVEGDPGIRPRSHIFVGSKAPWHEITDTLPQFEEWPPGDGWA